MITDRQIDQAFSDLRSLHGGVREDYFGLLYLENEHNVPRDKALNQVAFGGNDYGIDGFHFDPERRNLYLFQFKRSDSHALFKGTFKGPNGDITFDETGAPDTKTLVTQIQDGKFTVVWPADQATAKLRWPAPTWQ